ncbi:MAG: group II intron reverse transcriptase domain-containing protein [Clostridia bacterium]|nr:group II intron reverse transcriptase domain-containing protein [Clostridia bacterium]
MDKYQHVFEKFVDFETQYGGYRLARRDKRYRPEVLEYSANLEDNIIDGMNHLIWKDYVIYGAHEFYEYFPKKRIITAWPFRYRVVNCAAYLALWPIYSKSFYEHSYGSIPGMGQIKACDQLQQWLRMARASGQKWYVGKADVAKFFFRIPHEVQLRELGKPLDDPDMMWFLETCIKGDGRPTGLPLECSDVTDVERIFGIGMPVGSLISQMTANVVMTPLDHYMKRVVRIPRYIRYMDDMILMAPSKQEAWDALGCMDDYLRDNLGLQLNEKTAVLPADEAIEFVGKVVRPDRIDLRKSTSLQMKRHLRFVREAYGRGEVPYDYAKSVIVSYLGMLKHTSSTALRDKLLEDYVLVRHSE